MAATATAPAAGQDVRQTSLITGTANTCNGPVTDNQTPDQQLPQQQQPASAASSPSSQHKTAADSRPQARQVVLQRHETGFGFVAGSEKPVVVRFVTEGNDH
jgi:hypothetical protein